MSPAERIRAIRVAVASAPSLQLWACGMCRAVFLGPYRSTCPCGASGWWTGSIPPSMLDEAVFARVLAEVTPYFERLVKALGMDAR